MVGDPAGGGVEIDVCEHRRVDGSGSNIDGRVHHALHWDGYEDDHKSKSESSGYLNLGTGFHTYGLEWTESYYNFYVDNRLTWHVTEPISQRTQYFKLSSEVRDDSWAGSIPPGGYGDLSTSGSMSRESSPA